MTPLVWERNHHSRPAESLAESKLKVRWRLHCLVETAAVEKNTVSICVSGGDENTP
jgi:hypothetical protein